MTLTIQDLGALGELLGSVAVLATLVYLALQTRQNTTAIGAQLDAAFIAANQSLLLTAATSSALQEALDEDRIVDVGTNQVRRALLVELRHLVAMVLSSRPAWTPPDVQRSGARGRASRPLQELPQLRRLVGKDEAELPPRVRRVGRGATRQGGVSDSLAAARAHHCRCPSAA